VLGGSQIARLIAALIVSCAGLPAIGQPGTTEIDLSKLSQPQLQALAADLAAQGLDPQALATAEQILLRDPEDALAHYIVALVTLRNGQTGVARTAARLSFRSAETDRQHFEAARIAGKVAVAEQRWIQAQYWARQTIQFAPDPIRRDVAVGDFRQLRAVSPLAWSLRLGLRPSNNVNGGAEDRLNVIDGYDAVGYLSEDAMALPGLLATANLDASYRIAGGRGHETRLGFSAYLRAVELEGSPTRQYYTADGKLGDPERIPNSEYSGASLGVDLRHTRRLGRGLAGAKIAAGQSWEAGDPSYAYLGTELSYGKSFGPLHLSVGGGLEARDWTADPRRDTRSQIGVGFARDLPKGRLSGGVSLVALDSTVDNAQYWSVSGNVRYEPEARLGPLAFSFGAGLGHSVYPDYQILYFAPDGGRQDDTLFAEIGLWSPEISHAGFAPELKLQAISVDSNVSRFEHTEFAVAVGLRSTF